MGSPLTCKCTVHGCHDFGPEGRPLSLRIIRRHEVDERSASAHQLYIQAQRTADEAIEFQLDDISAHLSANTLSDRVSGSASAPGGRLWGKPSSASAKRQGPAAKSEPSQHCPPLRRNAEKEALSFLDEVDVSITSFSTDLNIAIQSLEEPSANTRSTVFPLETFQEKLHVFQDQLNLIGMKRQIVSDRKTHISEHLRMLQERLDSSKSAWSTKLELIDESRRAAPGVPFDTDHHFSPILEGADSVLQVSFYAIITCQIIFGIALRGCNFLLGMIQYLIQLTFHRTGRKLTSRDQKLLSDIPTDFRRTANAFNLEPRTVVVAVCPRADCHATYDPQYKSGSPIPTYPAACTNKSFKDGLECGTALLQSQHINGREVKLPIKRFVRVGFKDWLSGLLSRRGYEKQMDAVWENRNSENMVDIFDGEVLQDFKGADGKHFGAGGEEGRYVFSLCIDYFNPLGNKQAGKHISVGLISLVCLNLPSDTRYKPENMFLYGVIPGPSEPPLDCLNHYITALIDEFLELWSPGVRFSRTSAYHCSRLVKCALICLVCDLISARKTAGFVGVTSNHICAFCHCTTKDHGISNVDFRSWVPRTHAEYLASAERYKNAPDQETRAGIVSETGIRWSELLRLPYFDPARYVVVDAMHNLFLGLMREHCEIMGVRLNGVPGEHIAVRIPLSGAMDDCVSVLSKNEQAAFRRLRKLLQSPLQDQMADPVEFSRILKKVTNVNRPALDLFFEVLPGIVYPSVTALRPRINKEHLARAILTWRLAQVEIAETNFLKAGCILTKDEVAQIRSDIVKMNSPSWLTSVPSDFGEARHGKLKADQWRVLGTVYLPISLFRLWYVVDIDDIEASRMRRKLLDATIWLVSAIQIATSRTTLRSKAAIYRDYMLSYLETLKEIVPDYKLHPNHHMALHLGDYLCRFGPVQAWWTFPFERVIGMLQRIPTNFKLGQLEETISKSFIRSANLRALLMKEGCPEAIANCSKMFRKLMSPGKCNAALHDLSSLLSMDNANGSDSDSEDEIILPQTSRQPAASTIQALLSYSSSSHQSPVIASTLQFYTIDGRTFSPSARHMGNSSVLIRSRKSPSPRPVWISEIIQTTLGKVLFAVRYLEVPTALDPFVQYSALGMSLWAGARNEAVIVSPTDVISHFASVVYPTTEAEEHYVVIDLSRE